ncbi:MAG: 4'-phosphopantetheinyl transferase superfamily protein [Candidatus Omnitrophica bacterium]|nr:4'-phosphopantetheinyl transferase superfamily protein [Candidatus Omnitrophota bacterium]
MDIQLGIDIVEIYRFEKAYKKYKERFLKKIFSDEEIKYLQGDILKMCISFSFKESIWKALPEKLQKKYYLKEIKIGWKNEKPFLLFKINNCKIILSYSTSEKCVITSVFFIH